MLKTIVSIALLCLATSLFAQESLVNLGNAEQVRVDFYKWALDDIGSSAARANFVRFDSRPFSAECGPNIEVTDDRFRGVFETFYETQIPIQSVGIWDSDPERATGCFVQSIRVSPAP